MKIAKQSHVVQRTLFSLVTIWASQAHALAQADANLYLSINISVSEALNGASLSSQFIPSTPSSTPVANIQNVTGNATAIASTSITPDLLSISLNNATAATADSPPDSSGFTLSAVNSHKVTLKNTSASTEIFALGVYSKFNIDGSVTKADEKATSIVNWGFSYDPVSLLKYPDIFGGPLSYTFTTSRSTSSSSSPFHLAGENAAVSLIQMGAGDELDFNVWSLVQSIAVSSAVPEPQLWQMLMIGMMIIYTRNRMLAKC